jgi:predicted transcriptional regulator
MVMNEQLERIAEELKNGRGTAPVTTREFLSWFGAQRRGYWIVRSIREDLEEASLQTVPDFEAAFIDAPIELRRVVPAQRIEETSVARHESTDSTTAALEIEATSASKDATYKISKLAAANKSVFSIKPDGTLAEAVTILLAHDFSQLPVMTNERDVKGMVGWRSIGSRLALATNGISASDFMEPHHEIRANFSMFDAIPIIVSHQYVLVRGDDNRISGIITASDLSEQFRVLTEPFLLLGEIENLIRGMIGDHFSNSDLACARDPTDGAREIEGPANLNFGDYIRLLENPDRWKQFGLAIDRVRFCKDLDSVRLVRNDVMHFDPDGITQNQLDILRDFTSFLRSLQAIRLSTNRPKPSLRDIVSAAWSV